MSENVETRGNQLVNKFVVSLTEGKILGFVTDINVEVEGDEFYFILKMKEIENVGKGQSMFSSEKKMKIRPKDIVNVGPDVIILGEGKVPPLKEIERLNQIVTEYNSLMRELENREKTIEKLKEENYQLKKELEEIQKELRKLQLIKDDFDHLKEQLVRQEGQLEMAREYIRLLEGIRHDMDKLKDDVDKLIQGQLESIVRSIINEELNARGLKKTSFI
ncbi:MAG: preprotein translocase subunit SecG [Thermococcaceae archaeon]|nr:preprotein translocase subunit SecG [Thermococcaceae archaeon]